jgi:hypothetical protein
MDVHILDDHSVNFLIHGKCQICLGGLLLASSNKLVRDRGSYRGDLDLLLDNSVVWWDVEEEDSVLVISRGQLWHPEDLGGAFVKHAGDAAGHELLRSHVQLDVDIICHKTD